MTEALCWEHARRNFFEFADLANGRKGPLSPLALEAVRRIDAILDHERCINGRPAAERLGWRREHVAPSIGELESWLRTERPRLSRHAEVAHAMDYMLKRWPAFTRLLDDGRVCATNNVVERAPRGVAPGRKTWLFCGSNRGGERAAVLSTLRCSPTGTLFNADPHTVLLAVFPAAKGAPLTVPE